MKRCLLIALLLSTVPIPMAYSAQASNQATSVTAQEAAQAEFKEATKVYFEQGSKEALPRLQHALQSLQAAGDRKTEATALGFIGNCYKHLGDHKNALEYLTRSLDLAREVKDQVQEGKTLNHLGLLAWENANYPNAIARFQQSLSVATETGNKQLQASVLNNLGLVYDEQGDYEQSLPQYESALALDREIKFERGEAETIANIGGVYLSLGRFGDAIPRYEQSLVLARKLNLKPLASQAAGNLGLCRAAIGDLQSALSTFDDALQSARDAGQLKEEADWHKGKGTAYATQGKYDLARNEYATAIATYEKAALKRELVEALSDRGELYLELGDLEGASTDFSRAAQTASGIGYIRGVTDNLALAGRIEMRRGRVQKAEELFRDGHDRARTAKQLDAQAGILLLLSELERQRGKTTDALHDGEEALGLAGAAGNDAIAARARFELAEALLLAGRADEAVGSYDVASAAAHANGEIDLEWRALYGRGRAFERTDKIQQAIDDYIHAITLIESVRAEITEERFRTGYFQDKSRVYVDLVRLLIKAGRVKEAFRYSESLRTRSFSEIASTMSPEMASEATELRARIRQLQRRMTDSDKAAVPTRGRGDEQLSKQLRDAEREYQNLIDDLRAQTPQARAGIGSVPETEQVQKEVPQGSAILEYVVGENEVSEIVVTANDVWATTSQSKNLLARIELLRELIQKHDGNDWSRPASTLRQILIDPAVDAGKLNGIKRLYIVPNGPLHYLPFAVLAKQDQRGQVRTLISDYELAYLPSASVLARQRAALAPGTLLAVAPRQTDLVHTRSEVRGISRYFPAPTKTLSGSSATKNAFVAEAGRFRVIHLATHGYFDKFNPLFSGIELEPDHGGDGRLEVHDILKMRLKSELVTLSACETGMSGGYFDEFPAGDEFVGLTQAFLNAGSTAVLATLWSVNDGSTAKFMEEFYRRRRDSDQVTAMALAQRSISSVPGRFRHPYYWAPFVLTETGEQGQAKQSRKNSKPFRVSGAVGK